jgi:hypothetical protein
MEVTTLGHHALTGWREKIAAPVARKAPVDTDVAKAVIGFGFFLVSLVYVLRTIAKVAAETRR